jgi:hypothetical protein
MKVRAGNDAHCTRRHYEPDSTNGVNSYISELVRRLLKEGCDLELWHSTPKVGAIGE